MAKTNAVLTSLGLTFIIVGVLAFLFTPFGEFLDTLFAWAGDGESIGNIIVLIIGLFFFILAMASERMR